MKNSRLIPYVLMVCMAVFSGCSVLNTFTSNSGVQNMQTEKYMHDLNWITYTNQSKGLTFRYPKQILNLYNYFCLPIPLPL